MCGSPYSLCPPHRSLTFWLHRLQDSSKLREEGLARVGGTRGESMPTPPQSLLLKKRLSSQHPHLSPHASSPFSVSWHSTYFWSWKEAWKNILLPLPHYQSRAPSHPLNPQLLPWVLTSEGLGEEAHKEICPGILSRLVPYGQKLQFP